MTHAQMVLQHITKLEKFTALPPKQQARLLGLKR